MRSKLMAATVTPVNIACQYLCRYSCHIAILLMELDVEGPLIGCHSVSPAHRRTGSVRSYYSATLEQFCAADSDQIFSRMARENPFDLTLAQRDAWLEQAE